MTTRPAAFCPVCGQVIPAGPAAGGAVPGAGRGVGRAVSCPNRWCRQADRGFSVVFSLGVYEGALRRDIHAYKYRGHRRLAGAFAAQVAGFIAAHPAWFEEFELITSVPAYTGPGARRSWDTVGEVLARLPGHLDPGWRVEPGLVRKVRETPGMAGRSWRERQAVARGPLRSALAVGRAAGSAVAGVQVLLLDDVLTEGSTLREVARALRRAGASDVAGVVLGRPVWSVQPPAPK